MYHSTMVLVVGGETVYWQGSRALSPFTASTLGATSTVTDAPQAAKEKTEPEKLIPWLLPHIWTKHETNRRKRTVEQSALGMFTPSLDLLPSIQVQMPLKVHELQEKRAGGRRSWPRQQRCSADLLGCMGCPSPSLAA